MKPANLNHLENRILEAMHKLGSYLMESKITDWNAEVRHETCAECGTKLKAEEETDSYLGV